jgi:hypothetical protein
MRHQHQPSQRVTLATLPCQQQQQQQQPYHHFIGTNLNHLNVITLPPRLFTTNIDLFDAFARHYHHHV